ncbi:MAG: Hsp20/alpha crystallin family protein, partial [Desulfomonilaceae bacterium]
KEEKTENTHTIERSYGSFTRSIALPGEIVQDKAEATLKNGVLELRLPKTQLEKKAIRKIEVRKS